MHKTAVMPEVKQDLKHIAIKELPHTTDAETNAQAALLKRARIVGLNENSSEKDVVFEEKKK